MPTDKDRLLELAGDLGAALIASDEAQAERDRLVTVLHEATVRHADAKDAANEIAAKVANASRSLASLRAIAEKGVP